MKVALEKIGELKERATRVSVEGHVQYNPGWNVATDLPSMLTIAECVTRAALERKESRGGHTRDDYPGADPEWQKVNNRVWLTESGEIGIEQVVRPEMPAELAALFEESN
jgi:succinate dehydrogenase / fumarate reductase flavoprotein subunit